MGCHFGNFVYGGASIDATRWPQVAAYVERLHGRPSFKGIMEGDRVGLAEMTSD